MRISSFYSKIIAGTMTWGSWGKQLSKNEFVDLIHHCLKIGISTFDHADIYGDYANEGLFGKAFLESGIAREKVQLISKCGIQFDSKGRKNRVKHYDYSKEYIIWSVERSLQKLHTEYLDMLLLHRPSPLMRPEEIAEAVFKLKKEGKIKTFGVSNFTPSQIALLETAIAVECNQVEFSLTQNKAMVDGTFDDSITNGRMAMSWSPLGTYFKKDNNIRQELKAKVALMCEKYAISEDQLLLGWILRHPANVHPVVGTTTKSRLTAAMGATKVNIELQDWFILLEAANGREVA